MIAILIPFMVTSLSVYGYGRSSELGKCYHYLSISNKCLQ